MINEDSIERAIFKRMIRERGTYRFEDICRLEAEEIWNRANAFRIKNGQECPMPDDYFYGFLAACKFLNEIINENDS